MKTPQRILVIDDDENLVTTSARVLSLEGYDVRIATSPLVGLAEFKTHSPCAILLDFRMPFINAIGFLYRLRSLPDANRVAVAVITGDFDLDSDEMQQLKTLGATVYFKPIWVDELLGIARSLVAKASAPPSSDQEMFV